MTYVLQRPPSMSSLAWMQALNEGGKSGQTDSGFKPQTSASEATQPDRSDAPCAASSPKLRDILRAHLEGGELNLSNLSPAEQDTVRALTVDEWQQLHRVAAANGGIGIGYVECEAEMLPHLMAGLQQLPNLDCLSVWAPAASRTLDFGTLGQEKPLRVNILGTPEAPLQITACKGIAVEGREAGCKAIQQSVVVTKDAETSVAPESRPLPLPRRHDSPPPRLPSLLATALPANLTAMLRTVASQPKFEKKPFDPNTVVRALLGCGKFDEQSEFGFDLKKLTPEQVPCIQALPADAWTAVQEAVEEEGWTVAWLDVHEDFHLGSLAPMLRPLSPLSRITVSAPKGRGFFIDLDKLQGPGAAGRLQEVAVRPRADRAFVISVPHFDEAVRVGLAKDAKPVEQAHFTKCSVYSVDVSGKTIVQRPFPTA